MSRTRIVAASIAGLVAVVLVAVAAFAFGRLSTVPEATPAEGSAEAGFARDMQVHHKQGVELALIVRQVTDDAEVRLLADDIAATQAQQSGQLAGWLNVWDLPQYSAEPQMTWMTDGGAHSHTAGEPMPGLATPEEIAALRASSGVEAEREFLELMIAHHLGAVEMAEALEERSSHPVALAFARAVIASQQSEIELMQGMLDARG
ncbi:DUF305 domain-containing protein [Agromyces mediolanus]|uniref:DUF305 domain-containing protein n=1 Tax=Agromyces mediolanus TaxID=41986 RepID=UPI001E30A65A|nr:DUF305 domain-containing protein [Agromyces mediolanus]MCD1570855.1 DUF305 domain-containing protein [Agromyces mediolanus]